MSSDHNGDFMRDALASRGVDVARAIQRPAANPFAVILVAEGLTTHGLQRGSGQGERIVLWDRPAEMVLRPADLPADLASSARLVHVDDVDPDAAIAAGKAGIAAGVPVTSDIEAARPKTPAILTPSRFRSSRSTCRGPDRRAQPRGRAGDPAAAPCRDAGGHAGSARRAGARRRSLHSPAGVPVDVIDTTGAGDVFRAGFIYALLRGDGPEGILRFACAAAAVSCTRRGAMASVPDLDAVNALLA